MIRAEEGLKLSRSSSSAEKGAWKLLRKYSVVEEMCPMTKEIGKRVESSLSLFVISPNHVFHLYVKLYMTIRHNHMHVLSKHMQPLKFVGNDRYS